VGCSRSGLGGSAARFNNTYALALLDSEAQRLGLNSIGDLAKHPELKFGLSHEFLQRNDGWPGLQKTYGLPQTPSGLDHGLAYEAIAAKQIDVMDIYSTDAKIAKYKLKVLEDDKHYFPEYAAVLVYDWTFRNASPARGLRSRSCKVNLRTDDCDECRRRTRREKLRSRRAVCFGSNYRNEIGSEIGNAGWASRISGVAVRPGLLAADLAASHAGVRITRVRCGCGRALGVWARQRHAAQPILATVGVIQTIPSLALLAFLIPLLGMIGTIPALVALFLYSLLPIVRNTHSGLTDIPPHLRESARALGLPSGARLRLIELPLAARSILSGIKTSAVINVGTATIAAFIGAGGYGERIVTGLALNDNDWLLAGAIPAAVLALLVQGLFELADRRLIPAGLR
jgi:osmoprotectant transport system permease protein